MDFNKKDIGDYGENYVMFRLSEFKIPAIRLPPSFDFDIYTKNNIRIEVKTSRLGNSKRKIKDKIYDNKRWSFANHKFRWDCETINGKRYISPNLTKRNRKCDFFILLCLDEDDNICREYIVPKKVVGERRGLCIYPKNDILPK